MRESVHIYRSLRFEEGRNSRAEVEKEGHAYKLVGRHAVDIGSLLSVEPTEKKACNTRNSGTNTGVQRS